MRDWIAGVMAVLGTLLVLAGGTVIVLKALRVGSSGDATTDDDAATQVLPTTQPVPTGQPLLPGQSSPATSRDRLGSALRRITASDRLIGWGILLLLLAAVAAGAISFNLGAEAGTQ